MVSSLQDRSRFQRLQCSFFGLGPDTPLRSLEGPTRGLSANRNLREPAPRTPSPACSEGKAARANRRQPLQRRSVVGSAVRNPPLPWQWAAVSAFLSRSTSWHSRKRSTRSAINEIQPACRLTAELLGLAFLVAAAVGSGIMDERLAGGNVAIFAREHDRDRRGLGHSNSDVWVDLRRTFESSRYIGRCD
jgi:hypothetical protein